LGKNAYFCELEWESTEEGLRLQAQWLSAVLSLDKNFGIYKYLKFIVGTAIHSTLRDSEVAYVNAEAIWQWRCRVFLGDENC